MESDSISLKIKLVFHLMYKNKRGVILECKLPWLVYRDCYQLTAQSWYIMSIWESFSWRRLNQKPSVLRVKVKSLSHVWLFATPWTVASQASPSMGFSRQVYWSGLPFPSPMRESEVAQSCLTLHDPMDCGLPGSSVHGIFQARVLERGAITFSE